MSRFDTSFTILTHWISLTAVIHPSNTQSGCVLDRSPQLPSSTKYFLMYFNKGFLTEFGSVELCENIYKTPHESSLGKASLLGKIQNGRH